MYKGTIVFIKIIFCLINNKWFIVNLNSKLIKIKLLLVYLFSLYRINNSYKESDFDSYYYSFNNSISD